MNFFIYSFASLFFCGLLFAEFLRYKRAIDIVDYQMEQYKQALVFSACQHQGTLQAEWKGQRLDCLEINIFLKQSIHGEAFTLWWNHGWWWNTRHIIANHIYLLAGIVAFAIWCIVNSYTHYKMHGASLVAVSSIPKMLENISKDQKQYLLTNENVVRYPENEYKKPKKSHVTFLKKDVFNC